MVAAAAAAVVVAAAAVAEVEVEVEVEEVEVEVEAEVVEAEVEAEVVEAEVEAVVAVVVAVECQESVQGTDQSCSSRCRSNSRPCSPWGRGSFERMKRFRTSKRRSSSQS